MGNPSRIKNVIIGQTLQQKRESLALTRSEVAEKLGLLPQFVANWERGQCLPPKKILNDLIKVYKLSKKDIVKLYTAATKAALEDYFEDIKE